jgi:hypothetical protein
MEGERHRGQPLAWPCKLNNSTKHSCCKNWRGRQHIDVRIRPSMLRSVSRTANPRFVAGRLADNIEDRSCVCGNLQTPAGG